MSNTETNIKALAVTLAALWAAVATRLVIREALAEAQVFGPVTVRQADFVAAARISRRPAHYLAVRESDGSVWVLSMAGIWRSRQDPHRKAWKVAESVEALEDAALDASYLASRGGVA